jgi:tetratricopeptide (TPR) repeat protein
MIKKMIAVTGALSIALVFCIIAAAQSNGRIDAEILDLQGQPWAGLTVEIKNDGTGQLYHLKTDAKGKFTQIGLSSGSYSVIVKNDNPKVDYATQAHVGLDEPAIVKLNFKEIAAKAAANPANAEAAKKQAEEENSFQSLKTHFKAGMDAFNDSRTVRTQLAAAPADQKPALQEKMTADCQTAETELTAASAAATAKDVANHATILVNLGQAQECLGKFPDAADSSQKAIDLKPVGQYYSAMATQLAKAGKFTEANAACEKGVTIDPTIAAGCWKNMGIVLSNASKMKEAIEPLKKATDADPKDAQTWFLLGGAYAGTIDSKQEGDKLIYVIPPGTLEAYQKCIDVAPTGPYAPQAKSALEGLNALEGGDQTTIGKRAAKKKS